jgi:alpha-glucuronidase
MERTILLLVGIVISLCSFAEDGYRLWLQYDKIGNIKLPKQYKNEITSGYFSAPAPVLSSEKQEFTSALTRLLVNQVIQTSSIVNN